jgi:hypothetical protein
MMKLRIKANLRKIVMMDTISYNWEIKDPVLGLGNKSFHAQKKQITTPNLNISMILKFTSKRGI